MDDCVSQMSQRVEKSLRKNPRFKKAVEDVFAIMSTPQHNYENGSGSAASAELKDEIMRKV